MLSLLLKITAECKTPVGVTRCPFAPFSVYPYCGGVQGVARWWQRNVTCVTNSFFFFSTRNSVSNYQVAISEGTPPLGGSQVVFHPSDRNLLYSILLHKVLALDTLYDGHPLPLQVYSPYLVY